MKHKIKLLKECLKDCNVEIFNIKHLNIIQIRYYNREFNIVSMYELSYTNLNKIYDFEIESLCEEIKQKLKFEILTNIELKLKKDLKSKRR